MGNTNKTNLRSQSETSGSEVSSIQMDKTNKSDFVSLWQINLQRSVVASTDLSVEIACALKRTGHGHHTKNLIMCIQEPYAPKNKISGLPHDLDLFYFSGMRPRTAILATKELNLVKMSLTKPDVTACLWTTKTHGKVIIASLYLDITQNVITDELKDLILTSRNLKAHLIVCMDSNAHSQLWGNRDDNPRGEMLEQYLFQNDLFLHNKGNTPTFSSHLGESFIDLTLTNVSLVGDIDSWHVVKGIINSDHRLIKFNFRTETKSTERKFYNFQKADWNKFRKILEETDLHWSEPNSWSKSSLEIQYRNFLEHIKAAMRKSMPYISKRSRISKPTFWTLALKRQRTKVRKLECESRHDSTNVLKREAYLKARRQYKADIKKAKSLDREQKIQSIKKLKDMSRFVKIVQGYERHTLGMLQTDQGYTETVEETLELLLKTHFPGSKPAEESWRSKRKEGNRNDEFREISQETKKIIKDEIVRTAIASFGKDKSAGPDEIKPVVLQNMPEATIGRLTAIYRASLELRFMPNDWLETDVIFIPKPGKDTYDKAKSFRPISLSSFVLKGMEKVLIWHIEEHFLKTNPFSPWQHGFRKEKSTETAIMSVVDRIEKAILRGQYAVCVFLDIQGAFDNLRPEKALKAMKDKGVPRWFIEWYGPYLKRRYAKASYKGEEFSVRLSRGAPQGGISSTFSWNTNYDPFLLLLNEKTTCQANGFADDGIISMIGLFLRDVLKSCQKAINLAVSWGEENGLSFNPMKTEVIIFTRKRKFDIPFKLKMKGTELEYSKEARYLGVLIDSKLSWKPHMDNKILQAKRKLMQLRNAINVYAGPSTKLKDWAYKGIILPSLSYGVPAWCKYLENSNFQNKLRKLNRLAMLTLANVYYSTPTRGMEVILNYPPLHLYLTNLARISYSRVFDIFNNWDGIGHNSLKSSLKYLAEICKNQTDKLPLMDQTSKRSLRFKPYDLNKDVEVVEAFASHKCDIAIAKGKSWGISIQLNNQELDSTNLPRSVNETNAVLIGLHRAILALKAIKMETLVIILTSSKAYNSLLKKESKSKLQQEIHEKLGGLSANQVNIILPKPRINYDYRNTVKAMELSLNSVTGCEPWDNFKHKDLKKYFHNQMIHEWNREWVSYDAAIQTKHWLPMVIETDKFLLSWDKKRISNLIKMITGHGPFLYHVQKGQHESFDSTCRLCNKAEETAKHLLLECEYLNEGRCNTIELVDGKIGYNVEDMFNMIANFTEIGDMAKILNTSNYSR